MEQMGNGNIFGIKDETATDERKAKPDDKSSLSTNGDTLLNKSFKLTHFSFENIRFTPEVVEFIDAFEGKQFSVKITIQNIGRNPVFVKVGEPSSFIFQLKKSTRRTKLLASGTSIKGTVSYTYHNDDLVQSSQIPVQINGYLVDYPIIVKRAVPAIEVQPQKLNFKTIDIGASAKSMMFTIHNTGGKRTKFEVDVGTNFLDLVVSPRRGTVKAKNSMAVRVEMMGFSEGEYYQELWVNTSEVPIRIPVLVEVVRPRLEIPYPNGTEDLTLIDFRPTFNGMRSVESFVLKNHSAETTLYIALAEVDGKLQIFKDARNSANAFNMFVLSAEEGRLEPFESRILNVQFCPKAEVIKKGWHHDKNRNKSQTQREHIVFFRINRVHCLERKDLDKVDIKSTDYFRSEGKDQSIDYKMNSSETLNSFLKTSQEPEEEILRICLHGTGIEPDILIQPSDLEFGNLILGQVKNKVLKITNNSTIAVKCRLRKALNVKASPQEMWLKNKKSQEFLVSLTPTCAGRFKTKMKVEILAESDVFQENKTLKTIAVYAVTLTYDANDVSSVPFPKTGLGITPMITDEVGLQKELITYKDASKFPYAAMLGLKQGFKPNWMKKERDQLKNVDNAIIALPNDRPRLFYAWPEDKICRTIFKGFFRYSPPEDITYTLSTDGRIERKRRREVWVDYISVLRNLREENYSRVKKLKYALEYDISCKKHYNMENYKPDLNFESNIRNSEEFKKYMKQMEDLPNCELVPLTALFLYNINVEPRLINFSTVAVDTKARETVIINNKNPFPVSVTFIPGKSAVYVMEEGRNVIQPSGVKSIHVFFQAKDLGRYFGSQDLNCGHWISCDCWKNKGSYGCAREPWKLNRAFSALFLNYVINGSHEFKISIFAFVTSKALSIKEKNLNIEFGKYNLKDAFQPRTMYMPLENYLHAPVKYRWDIPLDSAFVTEIKEGEIPPRSKLLTEIVFELSPKKSFYSEVSLISENGTTELIKLSYPPKKISVDFLNTRVDMQDIPLNLPTKARPIIQNASYHDVSFEVISSNPMPGVTVEPKEGVIKARSFFPLDIKVQIPVIMKFSFEVLLIVHFVNRISVKVIGNVVLPDIRMKPTEVVLREICAHSFDTFMICVENAGTTPAEMTIDFKSCPEFKLADDQHKLYLPPKKSSKIVVNFEPKDVARYVFYLPVIINTILGPPSIQERATEFVHSYISDFENSYRKYGEVFTTVGSKLKIPCVCLNCTVNQSLIRIPTMNINFRMKSDFDYRPQNVDIFNDFVKDVTFCIRNDDLGEINDSPFNLIPVTSGNVEYRMKSIKVHLNQRKKMVFKATFNPKKPGHYSIDVPVFVKGYSNGLVYNYIHMSGELKAPVIYPEFSEIHFPPLPLGVGCDVILTITTENYCVPDFINCIVWDSREADGDFVQEYLTTKWLKEPYITQCHVSNMFQLQIKFQSSTPIALRNYILLFDSTGRYATVLVTAVADNSTATNHAFLSTKASKYKLIRDPTSLPIWKADEVVFAYPVNKYDLKSQEKATKVERKLESKSTVAFSLEGSNPQFSSTTTHGANNACLLPVDQGPRLVIQMTKSMCRSTQLGFVNVIKNFTEFKSSSSSVLIPTKSELVNSTISRSETFTGSRTLSNNPAVKKADSLNDVTYPGFPDEEDIHREYFQQTLVSVERWIYEVVMRCDQYFSIPQSFQYLRAKTSSKLHDNKHNLEVQLEKDFADFLQQIIGRDPKLPERPTYDPKHSQPEKASALRMYYALILQFLENKGCLLPHIKPEYLMQYEDYLTYYQSCKNTEVFSWKTLELRRINSLNVSQDQANAKGKLEKEAAMKETSSEFSSRESWKKSLSEGFFEASEVKIEKTEEANSDPMELCKQQLESVWDLVNEKQFEHQVAFLDKSTFDSRSTQAWLDIVIQIFRVFVLKNIVPKNTIPQVLVIEMTDKIIVEAVDLSLFGNQNRRCKGAAPLPSVDSFSNNVYSVQERILLVWLNHHLQIQKELLWASKDDCLFGEKVINNFDKDLSDAVALIAVTASHCPYVVPEFFKDVFPKPDTTNKMHHNAGKLIQAWRTLEIGITLETSDIIRPKPVFMVMLVTHLYEVLPTLHPHSLICFSAPLNSEISRTIQLKNESQENIIYQAKFFGEYEGFFHLSDGPSVELKRLKTTNVSITFTARKIKKISATLVFIGCSVSPHFGKHLAIYLEGEPTDLLEHDRFLFSVPLYKVICTEIPVRPPYPEPATYEVWYTTKKPEYVENTDIYYLFKPWHKIWNKKVSRRLFPNKSEVTVSEKGVATTLSVTVACLTSLKRFFWLLFRSKSSDFITLIEIKPKPPENRATVTGFYPMGWSASKTCVCFPESKLNQNNITCPFFTKLKIPARNDALWDALRTMFLKTLHPQEKCFWDEYFEMNIGICLILWLLSPEEEEEIVDEFIQVLSTKVSYTLDVETNSEYVTIPTKIDILDVRERCEISLPVHVSKEAPAAFNFKLTMTSENKKEVRHIKVHLQPLDFEKNKPPSTEDTRITNLMFQPLAGETAAKPPCRKKT